MQRGKLRYNSHLYGKKLKDGKFEGHWDKNKDFKRLSWTLALGEFTGVMMSTREFPDASVQGGRIHRMCSKLEDAEEEL